MQAQYVVTLDARDLLPRKVFLVSGHRPVQIESPTGFLRLLGRDEGLPLAKTVSPQPARTSRGRAASAEQVEVRDARIAALKALGHSGEPEKHSRNVLRWLKNFGLVYEKTAARLLGVSVAQGLIRLRAYAFGNSRPLTDVAQDVVARLLRFDARAGEQDPPP